jgi:phage shock protein PspC (stress-responsive transcriptional regulator)
LIAYGHPFIAAAWLVAVAAGLARRYQIGSVGLRLSLALIALIAIFAWWNWSHLARA